MDITPINKERFNLAGIVPVAGQPLDFDFPWHDCLTPIGKNYLAVEKAIFDCAVAGCDTIWVACPRDMQPLIRYRLGDYVLDPITYYKEYKFAGRPKIKEIPIYYVPMHPKDVGRRDCLAWSIITGVDNAYRVSRKLSRWTCPDKYFVSFPYGMFSPYYMKDHRSKIRSAQPFAASFEGKTFRDGLFLPFTLSGQDFIDCRKKFRLHEVKGHTADKVRIPVDKAYTGRYFTHDFVFSEVAEEDTHLVDIPWFCEVTSWDGLKKWLSGENKLDKPPEFLLSYSEWNPLGIDIEEEEENEE